MKDFQSLPFEKQEEVVRREGLPLRKSHLSTLQASRDRLLRETEELETLLSSTLFLRPEETTQVRESVSGIRGAVLHLERAVSLLEEDTRREENL